MTLRSRSITYLSETGHSYFIDATSGAILNDSPISCLSRGFQRTSGHGNKISLLGRSGLDIGGSFVTESAIIDHGSVWVDTHQRSGPFVYRYSGPLFAWSNNDNRTSTNFPAASSNAQLVSYGVTGIARALPTNPLAGMGQFIGELHDLPKVPDIRNWANRARNFKRLGKGANHASNFAQVANEYLNVQFGWVPFINDICSAVNVTQHFSEKARDYARNSGQNTRRRSTVFNDSSTTTSLVTSSWNGVPALPTACVASSGKLYKTVTTTQHIYFSGAFTYYLPTGDDFISKMRRYEALANKLYGVRVNPTLLYQLTPWSWAADWVSNLGDNVHNWSAFASDDLTMRYGYLMEERSTITSYSGVGLRTSDGQTINLTQVYTDSVKTRIQASPFGFGLSPGSFSPKQWSIVAALGISRGPRLLNTY